MNTFRKNWSLFLIGLITFLLGITAVVTALKLYQFGKKPVAPTVPRPAPAATNNACTLTFTIAAVPRVEPTTTVVLQPTLISTNTGTPVPTLKLTPTPTLTLKLTTTPTVQPTKSPTPKPTATPTPKLIPTITPTPTPVELLQAGISTPTIGAILGGIILLGLALLLAL